MPPEIPRLFAGLSNVMESKNGDDSTPKEKLAKIDCLREVSSLKNFTVDRILSENRETKSIFLSGKYDDCSEKAVVILEKSPFNDTCVDGIISEECTFNKHMQNDIYNFLDAFPKPDVNGIKTTIIYPATTKHLKKYEFQPVHIIDETKELYEKITLPFLQQSQFSLAWLRNIFEHKAELDRIVYEDTDEKNGFILLYDLSWDGKSMESFYLIAFCKNPELLSLRSLTGEHIHLLKHMRSKCLEIIHEKYGLDKSQLRFYFHYQPTFYHLHIHITTLSNTPHGINIGRAHLLTTVINNLELVPNYYQLATIPFIIKESDDLFAKFETEGLVKRTKK